MTDNKYLSRVSVSDFLKISQLRTGRGLIGNQIKVFSAVSIYDNSLSHLGILNGDVLIVKVTKHFNEANLYAWQTPNGRTAKIARENCAETTLHNCKE